MNSNHKKTKLYQINVRNLKNVNISFLNGELILFTGISGSGKSSLAFDTIFNTGRRNFSSTLPSFFSSMVDKMPAPAVETVEGLSPTIALKQKLYSNNPKSNIGTETGFHHNLAILYSLLATPINPETGKPIPIQNKEQIVNEILNLPIQSLIIIAAPISHLPKNHAITLLNQGFSKIINQKETLSLYDFTTKELPVGSLLLIDKLSINHNNKSRIATSISKALDIGNGTCHVLLDKKTLSFSTHLISEDNQYTFHPLKPKHFSSHTQLGQCTSCFGSGMSIEIISDVDLLNPQLSIAQNCCVLAGNYNTIFYKSLYDSLAEKLCFDINTSWQNLPPYIQECFLYGNSTHNLVLNIKTFDHKTGKKIPSHYRWKGILNEYGEKIASSSKLKQKYSSSLSINACPICKGNKISPYAAAALLKGKTFPKLMNTPIDHLLSFFQKENFSCSELKTSEDILDKINNILSVMVDLGLGYLTCNRSLSSLSGGERERAALSKQISSGPHGITYILDEPSIGLHPQDTFKLIKTIQKLNQKNNTVIIVEHEEAFIPIVDRIIDIGPEAGIYGGEITFNGPPQQFIQESNSLTAKYFRKEIPLEHFHKNTPSIFLKLKNASTNNLKNITVDIPIGCFTAITGVSGSGKSSLINDTLVPAIEYFLEHDDSHNLEGVEHIFRMVHITRDLPGRTSRSTPATYIKVWDHIRDLFASQTLAQHYQLSKAHFSFNTQKGVCPYCLGLGYVSLSQDEIDITCPTCHGSRFSPKVLEIIYKKKNIADVLNMTASEAKIFFLDQAIIHEKISSLCDLGLGYLQLGRTLSSLSGGECQRLKLATELMLPSPKPTIYVLDEPTTGLHTHDIQSLLRVLHNFTHLGHTIIIIEHNLNVINTADYIIDLGPEGGKNGGQILATCTPDQLIHLSTPTAKALARHRKAFNNIIPPSKTQKKSLPNIVVKNAYHHNLKHLNITIPRNTLSIITGPIGSGKHSLAFATLYNTGIINYSDLFPPYIQQQLIEYSHLPHVESITGLSPVVAINHSGLQHNSKNNFTNLCGITSYLQQLFTLLGIPCSLIDGKPMDIHTPFTITENLYSNYLDNEVTLAIPLKTDSQESLDKVLQEKQREGFLKIFSNNCYYNLDEAIPKELKNPVLVVRHFKIIPKNKSSIISEISSISQKSDKICLIIHRLQSIKQQYLWFGIEDRDGQIYPSINKELFSKFHHKGQCIQCLGQGKIQQLNFLKYQDKLQEYSLEQIIDFFFPLSLKKNTLIELQRHGFDIYKPLSKMSKAKCLSIFLGIKKFKGLQQILNEYLSHNDEEISLLKPFLSKLDCFLCEGTGLNRYALSVKINDVSFKDILQNDTSYLKSFLQTISIPEHLYRNVQPILRYLTNIINCIDDIGLNYIPLKQTQDTLSSGERYRLHIINKISHQLNDIIYILEDPASGLHPHDLKYILKIFDILKKQNNTIVACDRTTTLIPYANHIISLGPKSGPYGGYLTKQPPSIPYIENSSSDTISDKYIELTNFSANYCNHINLSIPLNNIIGIAGVSGSGKTTLLKGILEVLEAPSSPLFSHIHLIESHAIVASSKSDISTYLGISSHLRNFFSSLARAKALNLTASHFSTNTKLGMCSECSGYGVKRIERYFYAPEFVACEQCQGFMLQPLTQEVLYENQHFGEILKAPIHTLLETFHFLKPVHKILSLVSESGLDYLNLGKKLSLLSLGEKQLLKLIKHIFIPTPSNSLFLLEEPCSSLDATSINFIAKQILLLKNCGASIIFTEHQSRLLTIADYIVELGPGSGKHGGQILHAGSYNDIFTNASSIIKQYLSKT